MDALFQLFQRRQMLLHRPLSQRGGAGPPARPIPYMVRECNENSTLTNSGGPLLPPVNALHLGCDQIIKF